MIESYVVIDGLDEAALPWGIFHTAVVRALGLRSCG